MVGVHNRIELQSKGEADMFPTPGPIPEGETALIVILWDNDEWFMERRCDLSFAKVIEEIKYGCEAHIVAVKGIGTDNVIRDRSLEVSHALYEFYRRNAEEPSSTAKLFCYRHGHYDLEVLWSYHRREAERAYNENRAHEREELRSVRS